MKSFSAPALVVLLLACTPTTRTPPVTFPPQELSETRLATLPESARQAAEHALAAQACAHSRDADVDEALDCATEARLWLQVARIRESRSAIDVEVESLIESTENMNLEREGVERTRSEVEAQVEREAAAQVAGQESKAAHLLAAESEGRGRHASRQAQNARRVAALALLARTESVIWAIEELTGNTENTPPLRRELQSARRRPDIDSAEAVYGQATGVLSELRRALNPRLCPEAVSTLPLTSTPEGLFCSACDEAQVVAALTELPDGPVAIRGSVSRAVLTQWGRRIRVEAGESQTLTFYAYDCTLQR